MKIYYRSHIILYSFLTGLIIVMLAVGLGLFGLPRVRTEANNTENGLSAEANSASADSYDFNIEFHQTVPIIPVNVNTTDLLPYSESERENITIYEQLNQGVVNITVPSNWLPSARFIKTLVALAIT